MIYTIDANSRDHHSGAGVGGEQEASYPELCPESVGGREVWAGSRTQKRHWALDGT